MQRIAVIIAIVTATVILPVAAQEQTKDAFEGHPVNGEVGTWLAPSGSQICSPFACPYSRLQ